jgi:hypothetical protein
MVSSLTKRAGVDPYVMRVRPGDQTLSDVTGAREPSGIPWEAPVVRDKSEFRTGGPRRKFTPRQGAGNGPGNFSKRPNDRARGKGRPAR